MDINPWGKSSECETHGFHQDEMPDERGMFAKGLPRKETHGGLIQADRSVEQGLVVAVPCPADEDAGEDVPRGQELANEHAHLWQGQRVHGRVGIGERGGGERWGR